MAKISIRDLRHSYVAKPTREDDGHSKGSHWNAETGVPMRFLDPRAVERRHCSA